MSKRVSYRETDFIVETATVWFQRVQDGELTEERQTEFDQWFLASDAHAEAYNAIAALWVEVGLYEGETRQAVDEISQQTMRDEEVKQKEHKKSRHWRNTLGWACAALLLVVLLPIDRWMVSEAQGEFYDTARAQLASINLDDGSVMHLNAKTQAMATYTKDERNIQLRRGQALFDVASDKARPFVVTAGPGRTEAVGTSFDVNRVGTKTVVTVIEGRVHITALNSAGWSAYASAGEQVTYDSEGFQQIKIDDSIERFIAWRSGELVFKRRPLKEVVVEFNRFGKLPIALMDKELEQVRIDGAFDTDDTEAFLKALEWITGAEVKKIADQEYRVYKKLN